MPQQQPSGFSRLPQTSRYALIAIGVLILLIAALAVVNGGSQDDDTTPTARNTNEAQGDGLTEAERDAVLDEAGIPPEPDAATADAYIAALDAINPQIDKDDPESAINRGRDTCRTIHDHPDDRAHQTEQTNLRFTHPDHPDGWGLDVAEQILDAVHENLCPTY